jgi:hypothetical protein
VFYSYLALCLTSLQNHAIEEGAIAIGRAADPAIDVDAVYSEIDAIAREALRRLAGDFKPQPPLLAPPLAAEPLSSLEEAYLSAVDGMYESRPLQMPWPIAHRSVPGPVSSPAPTETSSEEGGSGLERAYLAGLDRAGRDEARADTAAAAVAHDNNGNGASGTVSGREAAGSGAAGAELGGEPQGSTGGEWTDAAVRALNGAMFEAMGYRGNRDDYYVRPPPTRGAYRGCVSGLDHPQKPHTISPPSVPRPRAGPRRRLCPSIPYRQG